MMKFKFPLLPHIKPTSGLNRCSRTHATKAVKKHLVEMDTLMQHAHPNNIHSFLPSYEKREPSKIKIGVGLSGGVDSSMTAYILSKYYKFNVIGVFMINWDLSFYDNSKTNNNIKYSSQCFEQELRDVRQLCNLVEIPLKLVEFQSDYWNDVFLNDYIDKMIENPNITPNPDCSCCKLITFGKFHDFILNQLECDYVATGHYANTTEFEIIDKLSLHTVSEEKSQVRNIKHRGKVLRQASDVYYDQTYFLSRINPQALNKHIFPLSTMYKSRQVRELSKLLSQMKLELGNEDKDKDKEKDKNKNKSNCEIDDNDSFFVKISNKAPSNGLCYVNTKRSQFKTFLNSYIDASKGDIIDKVSNKVIGTHYGLQFYTIGERILKTHPINNNKKTSNINININKNRISNVIDNDSCFRKEERNEYCQLLFEKNQNMKFYICDKDVALNRLIVCDDSNSEHLMKNVILATQWHWLIDIDNIIDDTIQFDSLNFKAKFLFRYQTEMIDGTLTIESDNGVTDLERNYKNTIIKLNSNQFVRAATSGQVVACYVTPTVLQQVFPCLRLQQNDYCTMMMHNSHSHNQEIVNNCQSGISQHNCHSLICIGSGIIDSAYNSN